MRSRLQPLEGRIKYLVSIGTGVPLLKAFSDNVLQIRKTLVSIATETEHIAKRFRRDKTHLNDNRQYYRFNIDRSLEEVGLEESKKRIEIIVATGRYIVSQNFNKYRVEFHLQNVPRVTKFVERPAEIIELEQVLLPKQQNYPQKYFVLYRLGSISKTQLAVEFVSQYQHRFSAVFWLDRRSKDSIMQSMARYASRIPDSQISLSSKSYTAGGDININVAVQEVVNWLIQEVFLQETGTEPQKYIEFYKQKWKELVESDNIYTSIGLPRLRGEFKSKASSTYSNNYKVGRPDELVAGLHDSAASAPASCISLFYVEMNKIELRSEKGESGNIQKASRTYDTILMLGILYKDQGKLDEAEKIYQRALHSYNKALSADYTSILNTVNNLGLLYAD
ncbi:uncharacterized protein RAG0_02846 [Rhynchosporium agropyri]|uniref:Uncharacterized protein n=1 Tax=Rhynchosporium agropyri TaxID=914238 RepID=A0A1E1K740_9HELO|nr:uncharacterized protein RAG0_02846 [Rhynchosporium agropyri]